MFWAGDLARAGLLALSSSLVLSDCADAVYGPPCFDGSYGVEFLERLPESTCTETWVDGWTFVAAPVDLAGPGDCQPTNLELVAPALPLSVSPNVAGAPYPGTLTTAGLVNEAYLVSGQACDVRARLIVGVPPPFKDIGSAAQEDAAVWSVPLMNFSKASDACVARFPEAGHCTEFYRARMTKLSDWKGPAE